jgi:hypothetical protein
VHLPPFSPGRDRPPRVVHVGQRVRAQVALGLLRLLDRGERIGEELVGQRRVLQPQPGDDDDWHNPSLCSHKVYTPARACRNVSRR